MAGKLDRRRIIVTGAASGMGRGIAELFAGQGAALALVDRNAEGLSAVAGALNATALPCDVSAPDAVATMVEEAAKALGGLDGLVNAAGVLVAKPFAQLDLADWDRMIAVNLSGPFHLVRHALPHLQAAERATVVNIASVSGFFPTPGIAGYGATKGGVIMFTKGLALDLGPGIRVNAICPGVIRTEMTRYLSEDPGRAAQASERVALKRLGTTDDIARAALFLSCEDSGFTTGSEVVVDGGFSWR